MRSESSNMTIRVTFPSHLTAINVWAENEGTKMGCRLERNNWSGVRLQVSWKRDTDIGHAPRSHKGIVNEFPRWGLAPKNELYGVD